MTSLLYFSDTNVLLDFAYACEMELLEEVLEGRGRWTASVEAECRALARGLGLPHLMDAGRFLGAAIWPTPVENVMTITIRDQLAGPFDGPRKHLGEAESIAIIAQGTWERTPIFVSADNDARVKARTLGIDCIETWDLVGVAVARGASAGRIVAIRERLLAQRRIRLEHIWDEGQFREWLSGKARKRS